MGLDLGTRTRVDSEVAAARARNDFPAIDVALADVVDLAASGDRDALDFLLQLIDRHRLAQAAVRKMLIDEGDDLSALTEEVRNMSSIVASRAMIQQALDELDAKFRDPVMMCDVEGMDYAAIAAALDIPVNTVRTRISRGRQYIVDRIQEQFRSGGSLA